MKIFLFIYPILLLFTACNDTQTKTYNGKQLLQNKCASCHNLDLPPSWDKTKLAPPMMAVTFHVYDLLTSDITKKLTTSKEFIKDYVINPNKNKSLCDENSLKQYGLMPSLNGKVTLDELDAISTYILDFYTKENLYKIQAAKKYMDSLSKGNKIALRYKCLSCHKQDNNLVGPSFKNISKKLSISDIKQSIKNGTKAKWQGFHNATMPAFKKISNDDLDELSRWIKDVK